MTPLDEGSASRRDLYLTKYNTHESHKHAPPPPGVIICQTTDPQPLPKRFLHSMPSRASSFKSEYPLVTPRSSSSFSRLLPHLLVTSICPCIFPSITCFKRHFLLKIIQHIKILLLPQHISEHVWPIAFQRHSWLDTPLKMVQMRRNMSEKSLYNFICQIMSILTWWNKNVLSHHIQELRKQKKKY
jgi:hypothetical protein